MLGINIKTALIVFAFLPFFVLAKNTRHDRFLKRRLAVW